MLSLKSVLTSMHLLKNKISVTVLLLVTSGSALAAEGEVQPQTQSSESSSFFSKVTWTEFDVGGISILQGSGFSGGVVARYIPSYKINESFGAGLSLDFANAKLDTNTHFVAIGYMAYGKYRINEQFGVRLNVGAQTWTCSGCKTAFVAGPTFDYQLNFEKLKFINNIWIGYLPMFQSSIAHELQAGVGFKF